MMLRAGTRRFAGPLGSLVRANVTGELLAMISELFAAPRPPSCCSTAPPSFDATRAAAVALRPRRSDEDPGVVLLDNIRTIFLALGTDRIVSVVLIRMLLEIEDGPWNEWRGLQDDRPPRKLTQSELAFLLRPFGIRPRTIWPTPRRPSDRSARGYLRYHFEDAWRAYCPAADTPTQPSKISYLRR
jgi:Protein of unknown function (DUF3631)